MRVRLGGLSLAVLLLAACGGSSGPPSSQIFVAPPWDGPERLTYRLLNQGNEVTGTCVAETLPLGEETELILDCFNDDGDFDARRAVVDSETLRPRYTERTVYRVDDDETTYLENEYRDDEVVLEREQDGDVVNTVTRDLPEPDDVEDPEPGVYDDNTIIWLARGLELTEEYDSAFHDVNAVALVHVVKVRLQVDGEETVEVPAGTYDTWRLRMDSETSSQRLWVDKEAPHHVVKARFEQTTFELTEIE